MKVIKKLWNLLWATDPGTWYGHLLQALVFFWPGYAVGGIEGGVLFVMGMFFHREVLGRVVKLIGGAKIRDLKLRDGAGDLLMPWFGCGICIALVLEPWGAVPIAAGAVLFGWMLDRPGRKDRTIES